VELETAAAELLEVADTTIVEVVEDAAAATV
jgi:hypothetical protein